MLWQRSIRARAVESGGRGGDVGKSDCYEPVGWVLNNGDGGGAGDVVSGGPT